MTKKRFIDGGEECIEDQFLIDTLTDKYYWIDNGLDDIVNMLNELYEENQELKKDIEYYKEERRALFEYFDKKDDLKLKLRVDLNG